MKIIISLITILLSFINIYAQIINGESHLFFRPETVYRDYTFLFNPSNIGKTLEQTASVRINIDLKDLRAATSSEEYVRLIKEKLGLDMVFIEGGAHLQKSLKFTKFDYGITYYEKEEGEMVNIDDFYLSRYPITVQQFTLFLNDVGADENGRIDSLQLFFPNTPSAEVNCPYIYRSGRYVYYAKAAQTAASHLTWYGANEFAKWAGGRLPNLAEWNYAGEGGQKDNFLKYCGCKKAKDVNVERRGFGEAFLEEAGGTILLLGVVAADALMLTDNYEVGEALLSDIDELAEVIIDTPEGYQPNFPNVGSLMPNELGIHDMCQIGEFVSDEVYNPYNKTNSVLILFLPQNLTHMLVKNDGYPPAYNSDKLTFSKKKKEAWDTFLYEKASFRIAYSRP